MEGTALRSKLALAAGGTPGTANGRQNRVPAYN